MPTVPPPPLDYEPEESGHVSRDTLKAMHKAVVNNMLRTAQYFYDYVGDPSSVPASICEKFDRLQERGNSIYPERPIDLPFNKLEGLFYMCEPKEFNAAMERVEKRLNEEVKIYRDINHNVTISIPTRNAFVGDATEDDFEESYFQTLYGYTLALFDVLKVEPSDKLGRNQAEKNSRIGNSNGEFATEKVWYAFDGPEKLSEYVNQLLPVGIRFDEKGKSYYLN